MSEIMDYTGELSEAEKQFILMAGVMGIERDADASEISGWVYGVDTHVRRNPESWDMIHPYFLAISHYWPFTYKNARERVRKWRKKQTA